MSTRSSLPQAQVIKFILEEYEKVEGKNLKIGKSKLIFINIPVVLQFRMAIIFRCGIEDLPIMYLGMLLFKGRM